MANTRGKATGFLLVMEVIFLVLFGLFVDYDKSAGPESPAGSGDAENEEEAEVVELSHHYAMFQDIHVMILIGFGFLMAFLKKHGFGSVGFNFLLTCFIFQWATLVNGWFGIIGGGESKIFVNIVKLIEADFAVAVVLISFGALLGKVSPIQLLVMSIFEVVFYNLSQWIVTSLLKVTDVGGSINIHVFGAYFGLAVSRVLYKTQQTTSNKEGSVYHSDIFSMIGTIFLWLYWPSFNAVPVTGNERHRAVINTVLSLAACTVVTFAVSAVTSKKNKLDMVHIQNATLAGGVAVGASVNLVIHPFGAMLTGSVAGVLSVIGFKYIQPALLRAFKIHDTCGVHNLHGIPGVLGAMVSAIACSLASEEVYKDSFSKLFTRDASVQGGFQIAGLLTAMAISMATGTLTGYLLKLPIWDKLLREELYDDEAFWLVPDFSECDSLAPSDEREYQKIESEEKAAPEPSYEDEKKAPPSDDEESLQQEDESN